MFFALQGEFAVRAVAGAWTVKVSKGEPLAPLHCPLAAGGRPQDRPGLLRRVRLSSSSSEGWGRFFYPTTARLLGSPTSGRTK
jgi:hypothetical protein